MVLLVVAAVLVLALLVTQGTAIFADATETRFDPELVTLANIDDVATISVTTVDVDAGVDGFQVNVQHPPTLEVSNAVCGAIFGDPGVRTLLSSIVPLTDGTGSLVGCNILAPGIDVVETTGEILSFDLKRTGDFVGDQILTMGASIPATGFTNNGAVVGAGTTNQLTVRASDAGNTAPEANAGNDRTVPTGETVTLDGSGSSDEDGDPLTFEWTLTSVPEGSNATASLTGADTAGPSFMADLAGEYVAQLVVNDGTADSAPDTVSITAGEAATINLLSDTFDRPDNPDVGEGWAELEQVGATVSIAEFNAIGNGKLFFDDTSDVLRRPLVSRGFAPVSTGKLQWDFDFDWARTAPDANYELWMQLGDSAQMVVPSDADTRFTGVGVVLRWGNFNGTDQSLVARQDATQGGAEAVAVISGPTHVSVTADLDGKTYSVTIDGVEAGSGLSFDNLSTLSELNRVRIFTDSLDDQNFSGRTFDNLIISTVGDGANRAPVAAAGDDRNVQAGETVTLDGSGSSDEDGDPLTFEWTLTSVPEGSNATASLTGAETAGPSFVADLAGTYVAELVVNDGTDDSAPDTVTVTAAAGGLAINLTTPGQFAVVSAPALLSGIPIFESDDPNAVSVVMLYVDGAFIDAGDPRFAEEIVKPVTAFYVKSSANATLIFDFAEVTGPVRSTKNLVAGWNLIGTNNPGPAVDELSPIQTTSTAAGLVTLHVPDTANGNKDFGHQDWESDGDRDLNASPITALPDRNLSVLDGYWAFLDGPRTYSKHLTETAETP
jgi:hypothetical protein